MRAVLQRVGEARVTVGGRETGRIGPGLLVLVGAGATQGDRRWPPTRYDQRVIPTRPDPIEAEDRALARGRRHGGADAVTRPARDAARTARSGRLARVLALAALVVLGASAPAAAQRAGGVLRAAMVGEPPTLDVHTTTAVITQQIAWHVWETLYTFDRAFEPIPLLAEGHTVADGGRRYTIRLRRGVRFHDGGELGAADVVASLERWGRLATLGRRVWRTVESVSAPDSRTVVIRLTEPSGCLPQALARSNNGAAIHPRAVVEAAGDGPLPRHVGTGPFRLVEHRPDRHVRLARFAQYVARPEPPDGYGGRRTAHVDEILFIPVPDVAIRLAGVTTGEYHFAEQIKPDQYERVRHTPGVAPRVVKPAGWAAAVLNHRHGLMADRRVREAVQAALDMEPIMVAGFGHPDFYRLQGSLQFPELPQWHSAAGTERYNRRDPARAAALLREAGYTGQPVRWLTTREYEWMYRNALVARQQLQDAGLVVDLQVVDWATLVGRRSRPELWDVFSTGFTFGTEPAFAVSVQCQWPGWWCHPEKDRLLDTLCRETDPRARRERWERVQALFYEDVGRIKLGDYFTLDVARTELRGLAATPELYFWNTWLER